MAKSFRHWSTILDKIRGKEKIEVLYDGDVRRLLDISRSALIFDDIDNLYYSLEDFDSKIEIVKFIDRFLNPTPEGYRDIKVWHKNPNGHIASIRFLASPILQVQEEAHPIFEKKSVFDAYRAKHIEKFAVVVIDMFNYMEPDGRMLIDGFPSFEDAKEYAKRRMRNSIEQLRTINDSLEALWELWFVFGEDVIALGNRNTEIYYAFTELNSFIKNSSSKTESDWISYGENFSLKFQRLLRYFSGIELQDIQKYHKIWLGAHPTTLRNREDWEKNLGHDFTQAILDTGAEIRDPLKDERFTNSELESGRRANLRGTIIYTAEDSGVQRGRLLEGISLQRAILDETDLSGMWLRGVNFQEASLQNSNLCRTIATDSNDFMAADFTGAVFENALLHGIQLYGATLQYANLRKADMRSSDLREANLQGANLSYACLSRADLTGANLDGANLFGVDLTGAKLVETSLIGANLANAKIYGVSVWNAKTDSSTIQNDLIITHSNESLVTVDNIEVGQLIYLLLNNEKIRHVIDTMTSKVVLILGRFTEERKRVLDAIREELRNLNYLPILFDFEKPSSKNLTETVSTIAHMARFVLADITDAKSIPQELERIIPNNPSLPIQPLILDSQYEYGMFKDFLDFPWVLIPHRYESVEDLLATLPKKIINPAVNKSEEISMRRMAIEQQLEKKKPIQKNDR